MLRSRKYYLFAWLLALLPLQYFAQQPSTKLAEYNIRNLSTIEERVFLLHSIQESEVYSFAPSDKDGYFDIYVSDGYTCDDSNANADFDFFLERSYEDWLAYTNLSKTERGNLFVEWRYQLDAPIFVMINEDFHRQLRDGNGTCDGALPFCTDNGLYQFPAGVNSGNLGTNVAPYFCQGYTPPYNPNTTGCLSMTRNPAFYYMRIADPGNLNIYMYSTPQVDIDFDCWGPFDDIATACDLLSCNTMVDCGYSSNATENCHINNALTGQYYILLITNFSNVPCNISFENVGTGTTDCDILPPLVTNDGPYCEGETISLFATSQAGASYSWTGPNNFISNEQNPSIANCTMQMSGTYTCSITIGEQSNSSETEVEVHAQPSPSITATPSAVIYGGTATLTADPGVQGSFDFHWEPADKVLNPDSQTTQTIPLQETTVFSVTVSQPGSPCVGTMQYTVSMSGSDLTATATADQYEICDNGETTLHALPVGGTGNYTYNWTPANTLNNAHIQNPVATPPVGTTTYHCQISDGLTSQEASVSILVNANDLLEGSIPALPDETVCDSAFWDPQGLEYTTTDLFNPANHYYTESDTYHRTYTNHYGCDSIVNMHIQLEYTPSPVEIVPTNLVAPHWVITATEFQVNSYDFSIWEDQHPYTCHWDSVTWQFEDPNVQWVLEPDTTTHPIGKRCRMYVLNHIDDTVWLRATVYNRCSLQGIPQRYWLTCSYYDIEERQENMPNFMVVPNPNNGKMTLQFENLTGKIDVKVYDMTGSLVDHTSTYSGGPNESIPYDLPHHSDGIYFIVVTAKEGTIAKKAVIKQ